MAQVRGDAATSCCAPLVVSLPNVGSCLLRARKILPLLASGLADQAERRRVGGPAPARPAGRLSSKFRGPNFWIPPFLAKDRERAGRNEIGRFVIRSPPKPWPRDARPGFQIPGPVFGRNALRNSRLRPRKTPPRNAGSPESASPDFSMLSGGTGKSAGRSGVRRYAGRRTPPKPRARPAWPGPRSPNAIFGRNSPPQQAGGPTGKCGAAKL